MARKRGERKLQILQALAEMLQDPRGERITTASLAAKLDVSEAALYRHFASKAQMYEGLIEFIESSLFGLINRVTVDEKQGTAQWRAILMLLLGFAEKNPGMTRVLIGEALVNEDPRLQTRVNQLLDKIEAALKQCLRVAAAQAAEGQSTADDAATEDTGPQANLVLCYVIGRWHQFAKSGFKRPPGELFERQWPLFAAGWKLRTGAT